MQKEQSKELLKKLKELAIKYGVPIAKLLASAALSALFRMILEKII